MSFTRIRTTGAVYALALCLTSLALTAPVQAAETPAVSFDAAMASSGKTLELPTGAKAGLFPGTLPGPADVTWTIHEGSVPSLPSKRTILGKTYRLTVTGISGYAAGARPVALVLPFGSSHWNRQIWLYDRTAKSWTPLATKLRPGSNTGSASTAAIDALVAIVEDRTQQEGIASWYCRRACSPKYPTFHGTSNDYPIGSIVKVTSHETGRSVNVKIISRWGQPAGRVVDLSWAAYAALQTKNKGVTKVTVSSKTSKVLGIQTSAVPTTSAAPAAETIPALTVTRTGASEPLVDARAYMVYDQGSGTVLAQKNEITPMPIASLTKLMTAMVFLDAKVDLQKKVTYAKSDITPYGYLRVTPGETMRVKDLFYSTLVGSANNGATALARSTGLSRAEFVRRMNAKAADLGLSSTKFVDVTGLDPANVSTAKEVALLSAHAFNAYPLIRQATTLAQYEFTTINTQKYHRIKATDKLLGATQMPASLKVSGGKTGYIDEALYTYALRTKNPQGAQVITVLLGAPTSALRFSQAATLTTWAFSSHRWST